MRITKYEHSCVVIEEQGRQLVVDPGKFAKSFKPTNTIDCVVVTHAHSDHFDPAILKEIKDLNPDVMICTTAQVAEQIPDLAPDIVDANRSCAHGPFHSSFYGGQHELYEGFANIGVMVNDVFYYPGDSYAKPDKPIKVLGAPAAAPWLRVTEASQFIKDCGPEKVIPMHNVLLSDEGKEIHYKILGDATSESGGEWTPLDVGETLEA
jgi:L-ascorbate metabolism protein UlaG (beta-lactamase superfamily)